MSFNHRTVLEEDENRAVFHSFPDPQQRHFKTQRCAKRTNFVRGNFYNNRKTAFPQDTFAQAINRVFQNFLFLPKEGIFIKGKVEGPFSGNLFTKIIILLCSKRFPISFFLRCLSAGQQRIHIRWQSCCQDPSDPVRNTRPRLPQKTQFLFHQHG